MSYKVDREKLAWAAGFFDGDGSVHVCHSGSRVPGSKYLPYPQVGISQSGEAGVEVLEKFYDAVGFGKIYGPMKPAKNQKQIRFVYEASGFEKTQAIMCLLWPWLGSVKRKKFQFVCAAYLNART